MPSHFHNMKRQAHAYKGKNFSFDKDWQVCQKSPHYENVRQIISNKRQGNLKMNALEMKSGIIKHDVNKLIRVYGFAVLLNE